MSSGLLRYGQMLSLQEEVAGAVVGAVVRGVMAVGPKAWVIAFEREGERPRLLLSVDHRLSRFHLVKLRYRGVGSPFAEQLGRWLEGKRVVRVGLVNEDRILELEVKGMRLLCVFVPHHAHLVLLDARGQVLCASGPHTLPEKSISHSREAIPCTSTDIEAEYADREREALRATLLKQVAQKQKRLEARIALHTQEHGEAEQYPDAEYCAQLLQANYARLKTGLTEIAVEDWKEEGQQRLLPLQPDLTPKEQVERAFKHVRKLKKRLHTSVEQLKLLGLQRTALEALHTEICSLDTLEALQRTHPLLAPPHVPTKEERAERRQFKSFKTHAGHTLLVGKSDKDNDHLSFSVARGNDLWFHISDFPGSHVVLQIDRHHPVDEESIQDALQLALHFSKAKDSHGEEVVFTECKHLSKSKGAPPGRVNISHHKKRFVRRDSERLRALFARGV